jgi:hypothetical protein
MHARLKTTSMQEETSTKYVANFREEARQQIFFKNLKAGDRRQGRKLGKSEVKQEQRQ